MTIGFSSAIRLRCRSLEHLFWAFGLCWTLAIAYAVSLLVTLGNRSTASLAFSPSAARRSALGARCQTAVGRTHMSSSFNHRTIRSGHRGREARAPRLTLRRQSMPKWRDAIAALLDDGRAMTFNAICRELCGLTAARRSSRACALDTRGGGPRDLFDGRPNSFS